MTPTSEASASWDQPDVQVYRRPKAHLVVGVVGLVFFSFLTGAGIALPLLNPDGSFARPVVWAIICGSVGVGFTALSAYLLLAYRRTRLYAAVTAIRHVGVFRSQTVSLTEVRRAVWRGWPVGGGSVVLHAAGRRLSVHFGNYADPWQLAAFFREGLPPAVQQRYERFEAANVPDSRAFRRRQDREERWLISLLPAACLGLVALVLWDPWDGWVRSCIGPPLGLLLVQGVRALCSRWRAGHAAAEAPQGSPR